MKKLSLLLLVMIFAFCMLNTYAGQSNIPANADAADTTAPIPSSTANSTATTPATSPTTLPPTTAPTQPTTTVAPTEPPLPQIFPMRTVTETGFYEAPDRDTEPVTALAKDSLVDVAEIGTQWATVISEGQRYYIPSTHLREPGRYLVVIDAGHQRHGNLELEPDGPGSSTMKYKVSYGTQGRFTGLAEYELTLLVAVKLQAELEARGYDVVMVRTSHDVDISNSERAIFANELFADVFIRLHANGSDNPEHNGIMTICQGWNNPYNSHLYADSRALSYAVLDQTVAITGANREYVWETNSMSGINWCQVPVTIVEMGYMTNKTEDYLMATDEYQQKLAFGIANGIDIYFEQRNS